MRKQLARLRTFCRPFTRQIITVLGLLVIGQATLLTIPWFQGTLIDQLFAGAPHRELYTTVALMCGALIMHNLIERVSWEANVYGLLNPISRHAATLSMERLTQLSIGQHIRENSGIKQTIISSGQGSLRALVDMSLNQILPLLVELGAVMVILMVQSWQLGCILLAGTITFSLWSFVMNRTIHPKLLSQQDLANHEGKFRGEILKNMDLVLQSGQEDRAVRESDDSIATVQKSHRNIWLPYVNQATWRDNVITATRAVIMLVGINLVFQNVHTTGMMVTLWTWSISALNRVQSVGPITRTMLEHIAAVTKFFELIETPPEIVSVPHPIRPERYTGDIKFEDVTLRYQRRAVELPEEEQDRDPSLIHASFHIPAGQTVAFVGESGAGKSSIVYALLRSQNLDGGRILVDGFDMATELDHRHFRSRIGVVSQSTFLFDKSLRYNMTYGLTNLDAVPSEAHLDRIAKMACVDRFMDRLEDGYDTIVGERGIKLSGGERQRIAIARALMKDPDILIFDEATSSLDPKNEQAVQEAIDTVSRGRTTIIIAHRYSTIRNADCIYVMDRGSIVGFGSHTELLESCPHYRDQIQCQRANE
jgi:ATP-binding cassette subfamily B protein